MINYLKAHINKNKIIRVDCYEGQLPSEGSFNKVIDMKAAVLSLAGKAGKQIDLPPAFSEPVRRDLIKRAVLAEQSRERQAYGSDPLAGLRTSAHYHGRRDVRNTMMNREMSRMARVHGTGFLHFRARAIPGVVKGRKAHPPKAGKDWEIKINRKEWKKALYSAIAATSDRGLVSLRGHKIGKASIPIILDDRVQELEKTKTLLETLKALGLEKELERAARTKTRAGRGKTRGRRTIKRKGPLIVVSKDNGIIRAGRNIPGIEIVSVRGLKAQDLAPGADPGRLTIWSQSAIEALGK
jgi:large subunit ribosomal protein L4e